MGVRLYPHSNHVMSIRIKLPQHHAIWEWEVDILSSYYSHLYCCSSWQYWKASL